MLIFSDYIELGSMGILTHVSYMSMLKPQMKEFVHIGKLLKTGISTKGIIVGLEDKLDLDQHTQYAPIVLFKDVTSQEYIIKSNDYRMIKPQLHRVVNVSYEESDPTNAVVEPRSALLFKAFLIGVILLVLSILNVVCIMNVVDK